MDREWWKSLPDKTEDDWSLLHFFDVSKSLDITYNCAENPIWYSPHLVPWHFVSSILRQLAPWKSLEPRPPKSPTFSVIIETQFPLNVRWIQIDKCLRDLARSW
jgi:hypothetical protein